MGTWQDAVGEPHPWSDSMSRMFTGLEHPVKLHQRSPLVPEWTEPLVPRLREGAGGPLPGTQNAEPSTVTAFELHVLLEVVYAVVGGIPSVCSLDGAI